MAPAAAEYRAALAAGTSRFFRRPLVRGALLVGRPAALAGDLLLTFGAHRREAAPLFSFVGHVNLLAHRGRQSRAGRACRVLRRRLLDRAHPTTTCAGFHE